MSAAAASSSPAFDYTGFKLGEKKTIKDSEAAYNTNLAKIRATLGAPTFNVEIDWPAFQAALTEESDRKFAGEYIYSRYVYTLSLVLDSLAEEKLAVEVARNLTAFVITIDKSDSGERQVLSVNDRKFIVAVSKSRMSSELDDRPIQNFLKNNLRIQKGEGPFSKYAGFTLGAAANWLSYETSALTPATTALQAQLPGVTFRFEFDTFINLIAEKDAPFLGDYIYDRVVTGISQQLVSMCEESADYKEALAGAVRTITILADTTGEEPGERYVVKSLEAGNLSVGITPSRLAYGFDGRNVQQFLEKNL